MTILLWTESVFPAALAMPENDRIMPEAISSLMAAAFFTFASSSQKKRTLNDGGRLVNEAYRYVPVVYKEIYFSSSSCGLILPWSAYAPAPPSEYSIGKAPFPVLQHAPAIPLLHYGYSCKGQDHSVSG